MEEISRKHHLANGMYVFRNASPEAIRNERPLIVNENVLQCIRRKYPKEGKSV